MGQPGRRNRRRLFTLAVLSMPVVLLGRELYLPYTATPGHAIDYASQLRALVESRQPSGLGPDDALALLLKASQVREEVETQIVDSTPQPLTETVIDYAILGVSPDPSYMNEEALARVRDRSRDALARFAAAGGPDLIVRAAAEPRAVRNLAPGSLMGGPGLDEATALRNLARLSVGRMAIARQAADWPEFVAAYEGGLAAGRVSLQQGLLIDQLCGVSMLALLFDRLRDALASPPPELILARLLEATDRQLALVPPRASWFLGEHLCFLDAVQFTHTDNGRGSGRALPNAMAVLVPFKSPGFAGPAPWLQFLSGTPLINIAGAAYPSKAATLSKAEQLFDGLSARANYAPFERDRAGFEIETFMAATSKRYVLLHAFEYLDKALQSRDASDVESAGVRIWIALEIFRARNGHYPAALKNLTPSILASLPPDPYSGRDFLYNVLDPASDPRHRSFILYSVGFDRTDNGGAQPDDALPKAEYSQGTGYDYIVNAPH